MFSVYYLDMRPQERVKYGIDALQTLMEALGSRSKAHFANDCSASANAATFWFKEGEIPPIRLKYAARKLHKILQTTDKPSKAQLAARDALQKQFKKDLAEIVAEPLPPSYLERRATRAQETKAVPKLGFYKEGLYYPAGHLNEILTQVSAEDLVDALQKKGWIVNLSRKDST